MVPFGGQDQVAVVGQQQLVQAILGAVVAVDGPAALGAHLVVVGLLNVQRAHLPIVPVGGPARPGARRGVDLVEDQPLGGQVGPQDVRDLAQRRASTPHLHPHLGGLEQAQG